MPRAMPILLVFMGCVSFPLAAFPQTGLGRLTTDVYTLDKNFVAADRNHDGLLDKAEAEAGSVPFIVRHFDSIDTRHRGQVSKDEVHAFIKRSLMRTQPATSSSTKHD
jgi:hypothetical protein